MGAEGESLILRNPVLVNDSVVALSDGAGGEGPFAVGRPGIAWDDVRSLEVARVSTWRTIALAGGIALVSAGWAAIAGGSEGGRPPPEVQLPKGLRASSR